MNSSEFVVYWINPITRGTHRKVFTTREEAERYVEGRGRKYSAVRGYERPTVEGGDGQ